MKLDRLLLSQADSVATLAQIAVAYVPKQWEPPPETVNRWGGRTRSWRRVRGAA